MKSIARKKHCLRFDTVKFMTDSQYLLTIINEDLFKHDIDPSTGEVKSVEFNSKYHRNITPFELYIHVSYQSKKMAVEFSSKLLLDDCPQLISGDNFSQCLLNIEKLGVCTMDIEGIIKNSYFNKLHITQDVKMELTIDVLNGLNLCTGDYRRYNLKRYENYIQFTNDVKSVDCKEAISVYNKGSEILLSKNKMFLSLLSDPETIVKYFKGKTRFEVKFENRRKIKKELGVNDTTLNSLMEVDKNVILAQFDKIFTNGANSPKDNINSLINNIADYGMYSIIRCHDSDLKKIEQEIKDLGLYQDTSRCAMNRQMKKIKDMAISLNECITNSDSIIREIRNKLKK